VGAVIDIHTHVVPSRLAADPKRDRRWPSVELSAGDNAAVMIGGKVFRKIDARSWDVGKRLSDMIEDGTDMQVLSPMPELLSHWLPADDAEYLADVMNDEIAAMIAQAPENFAGIGMVCAQDVPRALRQLQKVKALGLAGIEIGTHINGTALGSDTLFPIYEAAEALHGGGDCALHRATIGDVGGDRERAVVVQLRGGLACGVLVEVDDRDRRATREQRAGGGEADPARGAGDQRDLAAELEARHGRTLADACGGREPRSVRCARRRARVSLPR